MSSSVFPFALSHPDPPDSSNENNHLNSNLLPNDTIPTEEIFTSRDLNRKFKNHQSTDVLKPSDIIPANILNTTIEITGSELKTFILSYEKKLIEYLDIPFLTVLTADVLSKRIVGFSAYVRGTAICKHYEFPVDQFIESQFYYHDRWKECEPSLRYMTSLDSHWNSVGRYKEYRKEVQGTASKAYKTQPNLPVASAPTKELVAIYQDLVDFQVESTGRTPKQVLQILGMPGRLRLPISYLKTLAPYIELVEMDAWGPDAYNFDFYIKLKTEIENNKNVRSSK